MNKPTLIYIASNGRSGSTLLEMMLNTLEGCLGLGELSVLRWEIEEKRRGCSCGKKLLECDFWQPVVSNLNEEDIKNISPFRDSYGTRELVRNDLVKLIKEKPPEPGRHKKFCNSFSKFLKTAQKARNTNSKEITHFIDSSKGAYRLWWLNNCKDIDVKTIHLTKDPRGFVHSMTKRDKSLKKLTKTVRMSIRYRLENYLIEKAVSKNKNCKHLKYEDLASRPGEVLKDLADWLNLDYIEGVENQFNETEAHALAGNKMREYSSNIKLDESWKNNLPEYLQKLTWTLTYPKPQQYEHSRK